MDQGRIRDLQQIQKALNDKSIPQDVKRRIEQTKGQILAQANDKKLAEARTELFRARNQGRADDADQISDSIAKYAKGKYTK